MFIYIAFKSRNNLMSFYRMLKSYISANIVNTPRSISSSCGLSIKTERRHLRLVLNLIQKTHVNNLLGIYSITRTNSYDQIERIY